MDNFEKEMITIFNKISKNLSKIDNNIYTSTYPQIYKGGYEVAVGNISRTQLPISKDFSEAHILKQRIAKEIMGIFGIETYNIIGNRVIFLGKVEGGKEVAITFIFYKRGSEMVDVHATIEVRGKELKSKFTALPYIKIDSVYKIYSGNPNNYKFYQVVRRTDKTAFVREIESSYNITNDCIVPAENNFIGQEVYKVILGKDGKKVSINNRFAELYE